MTHKHPNHKRVAPEAYKLFNNKLARLRQVDARRTKCTLVLKLICQGIAGMIAHAPPNSICARGLKGFRNKVELVRRVDTRTLKCSFMVLTTCHVLAGVVAHALHNSICARVAHAEALCCHAAEVCLSLHRHSHFSEDLLLSSHCYLDLLVASV